MRKKHIPRGKLSFPTPIALYTILPWNPTQPTQLSIWAFTPINWSSYGIHWAQLGVPLGSFGFQNGHQLPFSQKFGTMTHAQIRKVSEKNTKWSACVFVVLLKRCAECCRRLDFEWQLSPGWFNMNWIWVAARMINASLVWKNVWFYENIYMTSCRFLWYKLDVLKIQIMRAACDNDVLIFVLPKFVDTLQQLPARLSRGFRFHFTSWWATI